jgi:twitching motility protein PilT
MLAFNQNGDSMDITHLLALSVKHNASDLHLSAGLVPMVRIDGEVRKLELSIWTHQMIETGLASLMNQELKQEMVNSKEVDFAFAIDGVGRFRANFFQQARGYSAVFRHIKEGIPSLSELDAPDIFVQITQCEKGLVLVTGPTGSGKSTTLAALIDHINHHQQKHILTIEDPIEFVHISDNCLINQREVKRDTHSFKRALRSALREDPDVILVGELRDHETISLALTAAETGHLVLATLHTSSAAKTVNRVVDVFPSDEQARVRSMLSESLQAVISQTLLKRAGGGRIGCYEVMLATPAVRNLIRENKVAQLNSTIETGAVHGMNSMVQYQQRLFTMGKLA